MMKRSRYGGSPNIGVYTAVNESLAFIGTDAPLEYVRAVESILNVKTILTTVAGSHVVGSLVAMNSNGAIMSDLSDSQEIETIQKHIPVLTISDSMNAAGNNILVNDYGALINPDISTTTAKDIENILGVEVVKSCLSGYSTVGSVCVVTNKGCVCNIDTTDEELDLIENLFKVEARTSSVNHGIKYIGAGLVANSKGAIIGDETTPIEMGKIEDGLALFD